MQKILTANFAQSALAAAISSAATSLTVTAGTGTKFPEPAADQIFKAVIFNTVAQYAGFFEILDVISRAGDAFDQVVRNREDSNVPTAGWPAGSTVVCDVTAGTVDAIIDAINASITPIEITPDTDDEDLYWEGAMLVYEHNKGQTSGLGYILKQTARGGSTLSPHELFEPSQIYESVDGNISWIDFGATPPAGSAWELVITTAGKGDKGDEGDDGVSAFVYSAWASDDIGTGFTLTHDPALEYMAILSTVTALAEPEATDFEGLWFNRKGLPGDDGDSAYVYSAWASDDEGTDFTLIHDPALEYMAILATDTEITSPDAADFAGLWFNRKGIPGDPGEGGGLTTYADLATMEASTAEVDTNMVWCTALATLYQRVDAGSAYTRDGTYVANTGSGGNTRFVAKGGAYTYDPASFKSVIMAISSLTPEAHGNQTGTLSASLTTYQAHSLTVTGNLAITTTNWTTGVYQEAIYIIQNGGAYTLTIDGLSFPGLKTSGWDVVKIAKIHGTSDVMGGMNNVLGAWE